MLTKLFIVLRLNRTWESKCGGKILAGPQNLKCL